MRKNKVINKKQVRLNIVVKTGLADIEVRFLPAEMAYDYYLNERIIDLSMLGI